MKSPAKDDNGIKPVGIWIRVSTEDQAKGESPEHHEARARMYAEFKGWAVVTVYHLEAVSGKTVMEHPEAKRMLADVKHGRITGLIFSKLARVARNTRELLEVAEIFEQQHADLISLQESIDTSTPAGRFFYTLIAAMSQWEREEIADRVKASVVVRAKLGKTLGGAAPFGYEWHEGKLRPNAKEAPIRALIYELFAIHRRLRTVARLLNEKGYRTRRGANFSYTTVRRLIEDPTAKGLRRANYTESLGDGKQWKKKPESEWVWTKVEPVVSEELWEECNLLLAERKKGWRPAKKTVHLFSSHLHCTCGGKMYVPSGSKKYTCGTCRSKIPTEDLERVFVEKLRGFFFSKDDVATYLAEADEVLTKKRELHASLQKERDAVAGEMEKLYQLYLEGEISTEGFGRRNRPLEERLTALNEELPRLQAEVDFLAVKHLSSAEIVSEAQSLYTRWDSLAFEEKRQLVENIVERVEVGDGEIGFDIGYAPTTFSAEPSDSPALLLTGTNGQRNRMDSSPPPEQPWLERPDSPGRAPR